MPKEKVLLIITQVYPPDPAAVGQYMADVAVEMAGKGWRVMVMTASRGYDDPGKSYPARELKSNVEIRRFSLSSFGKNSIFARLLGGGVFTIKCFFQALFMRDLRSMLVATSPPLAPLAAVLIKMLRQIPYSYWVMDINPDQTVRLGLAGPKALAVRIYDSLNLFVLKRANQVITLDQDMAMNLKKKIVLKGRLTIIPPWPLFNNTKPLKSRDTLFRKRHRYEDKFIFMYSGNHSMAHPLQTLLEAIHALQDSAELMFAFVGGGVKKKEVERFIKNNKYTNIASLPYQPLENLADSLAAADVHIVCMGNEMVGVVHPSKVYGAMAVGRPVLALAPADSSLALMVNKYSIGWLVEHGDVEGMVKTIKQIADTSREELQIKGIRARELAEGPFSREKLLKQFISIIDLE